MTNEFERAAAAQASAPDPAWIASIANSLFRGVPVDAPPGPGASLPSAPAFAHEPVMASVPGAPRRRTAGVAKSDARLQPACRRPGASVPASPVHAYEPLAAASESVPAAAAAQLSGEKGAAGAVPASPSPPLPSAGPPQLRAAPN